MSEDLRLETKGTMPCAVLDVRPYHERGEEPFQAIMDVVYALKDAQQFLLINSFDPKPLVRVMDKRGYDAVSREVSPEEWHVLFSPR